MATMNNPIIDYFFIQNFPSKSCCYSPTSSRIFPKNSFSQGQVNRKFSYSEPWLDHKENTVQVYE